MNKVFATLIVMLGLAVSSGLSDEIRSTTMTVSMGAGTNHVINPKLVATNDNVNGFVEEVVIDCPVSTTTQTVSLAAYNLAGDETELATNVVAGASQLTVRPRVKTTGVGGVATTTDTKFLLLGETLKFSVTNSAAVPTTSNQTWKCTIKTSRSGGQ